MSRVFLRDPGGVRVGRGSDLLRLLPGTRPIRQGGGPLGGRDSPDMGGGEAWGEAGVEDGHEYMYVMYIYINIYRHIYIYII